MQPLRKQAEIRLRSAVSLKKCAPPSGPRRLLAHELEVHQMELELQNEELERARAEIDAVRARYESLYDHAPVAFLSLDGTSRVVEANAAVETLLGTPRDALLGRPLSAFMRTADADAFHLFRQEVLRTGQRSTCELSLRRSGGGYLPVHVVVNVPSTGRPGECLCALFDLAELRGAAGDAKPAAASIAQAALDAAPVAIVTSDGRGRIVSFNAAAERTFGYALEEVLGRPFDLLLAPPERTNHGGAEGRRKDGSLFPLDLDVAEWCDGSERMVTATLRAAGTGEPGPSRPARVACAPVEIDEVLSEADALLRPILGEHIELMLRLEAPNAFVSTTQAELEQVLRQLAANSRDAMPAGGMFVIRSEVGDDGLGGRRLRLRVSDTGHGMEAATKARVFEPFFTTKAPGRGNGLQAVLSFVERIGGEVTVESAPGHGTTIALELPLAAPEVDAAPRVTVLVVEGDDVSRSGMRKVLARPGLRVRTAATAVEARTIAGAGPIDVLVTDARLADGSGDELAEDIRRIRPRAAVIYVSGAPPRPMRVPGPYLEKPVQIDRLVALIDEARAEAASAPPNGPPSSAPAADVVVRRRQANGAINDFAVRAPSASGLRRGLRSLLVAAAEERGLGLWSEANPEVWVGGKLVATLTPETDPAALAAQVFDGAEPPSRRT